MCHQFARAGDATRPTKAGMINQAAGLFRKQLIERQRGRRVVGLDVVINLVAVLCCVRRPE
jgi:hypothetical protein